MKVKDLLHKPNQTTMIANGTISLVQRKAYNIILLLARLELKKDQNKILFNVSISEIKNGTDEEW